MKYFKAFHKGMVCNDKQYQENTVYEEDGGNICCAGMMHFCETPFDTLDYYPLVDDKGNFSEFAEVEALDEVVTTENKCASKKIRIGAKLSFKDFIKAGVDILIEKTKPEKSNKDTDLNGNGKNKAQIGSSGNLAQIGSSGNWAKIGSSGNLAQIGSSGDWAKIGSSGDEAQIGSSGNWAKIGSSGARAKIKMQGERSVAAAVGYKSSISGKKGDWIVLAEWRRNHVGQWYPACVKSGQIDGEVLLEDVMYKLENGEFIKCD